MPSPIQTPHTSIRLTTSTGPLAQIWLAANMSNLPRNSILQTSITESADEIAKASGCNTETVSPESLGHLTLHTSGDLLQGIVRVYSKQAVFLLNDIKETLTKISSLFKSNQRINITLSKSSTVARVDQLILEDAVTEREVLLIPDLDFLFESTSKDKGGIMARESMMERKVRGAAPWDTSLEVGRRFNPDEEFEYHQSSALDLDFDIEEASTTMSKAWEEGTRQTALQDSGHDISTRGSTEPGTYIARDDFPLEEPNEAGWDLGISEKGERGEHNENDSEISVEVGRRAVESSANEMIDFGFDLDIEKEPLDQQTDIESEISDKDDLRATLETKPRERAPKPKGLLNIMGIAIDEDTELSDEAMREYRNIERETGGRVRDTGKLNKKRLFEDLAHNMEYLPKTILENLFSHQALKKPRTISKISLEEPEMDISLGIDHDLLQSSIVHSSDIGEEEESSDHFVPIGADIGQPPIEEEAVTPITATREATEEGQEEKEQSQQIPRVRLVSGEFASKSTVYMAELLRTEFIDNESITFDDVLISKHDAEQKDEPIKTEISKAEASKGFFELLSLASAGCIELDQPEELQEIHIKTRAPLYEKFITA